MRVANVDGRLKLIVPGGAVDVERASNSRFSSDPQAAYTRFDELRTWSNGVGGADEPFDATVAGPPVPGATPGLRHRAQLRRPCRRVGNDQA